MDDDPFNLFGLSAMLTTLGVPHEQDTSAMRGFKKLKKSYDECSKT